MTELLNDADINEAWDRIARTSDGQIIYRHLMRLVMACAPDDSALPRREGARNLARNLMDLMADGIADNDRYCVAFPRAKSSAADSAATGLRRVTLDDAERVGNTELDKSLAAALAGYAGPTGNGTGGAT